MELTEKEKATLSNLVNPDNNTNAHFYDFPIEVQQELLGCLLTDKYFFEQSMSVVKPHYFNDKAHQRIARILFEYFHKYNQLPDKLVIELELAEQLEENPAKHYYFSELELVLDSYIPGLQKRDYLLDKITEFAKVQALRTAYSQTLDILYKNTHDKWAKIKEILQQALLVDRNVDLGLNYFRDLDKRYQMLMEAQKNQDFFTTGFPTIDAALSGGLTRGEVAGWCAMSGGGKSLCLVKAAIANLQRGRKVLYITLEMDEPKTANRFDAQFAQVPILGLLQEQEDVLKTLRAWVADFDDPDRLYIKQFPAGAADVTTIRAYLSQLSLHGFHPDMIVVDYVGELRDIAGMKTYESRQRLVRDLRGLAVEAKICIFTAMQVGRTGREAMTHGYIDDNALADSQGQIRPLDALWSINQNEAEQTCGVGKIFVVKHRNGASRFTIYFERNSMTLDTNEITLEHYKSRMSEYQKKASDNVDIEGMATRATRWQPNKSNAEIDE